jgi:predicted TIM-barrel fold metal-dependent hydrolase
MSGQRIDCHAHVIDPARFPYVPGAGYQPKPEEAGPREAFAAVLEAHGVSHALLIQPSCYGVDNAAMLDAIAESGGRFKGIARASAEAGERELARLADRGVVGLRFNLVSYDPAALATAARSHLLDRMRALGWHAQIYADDAQWPEAARLLRAAEVEVLVDHFGIRDPARSASQPGFQAVLALGRDGLAAVKLSASFRLAPAGEYSVIEPYAEALLRAFGVERCVWGSDWPFLAVAQRPGYRDELAALARWLPHPADRDAVLWRNPRRLFGFGGPPS